MKRWLVIFLPLLILFELIGLRLNAKKQETLQQAEQGKAKKNAPRIVSAVPVDFRDIVSTYSAVGTVESPLKVQIAPKVTGRIEFLQAREGDKVTQGAVVARIDDTQVEADVRQERANVAEAQSRLAQAQITLNPTSVGVVEAIRQQQATVASAQADYNQVRENLSAQIAAANADVSEAQSQINSASAQIANAKAGIQSAQANLDNANGSYKRLDALLPKGYVAKQDVEDAQTQVKVREGEVAVANGQLATARADYAAAVATKRSRQQQANIVATKGKADVEAARAKVVQAQAALRTARANTAQTSAYRQNLAALQSTVSAAVAALRSAESLRADTMLRSPIDGVVTERMMDPGAVSGPGQPLLTVQSVGTLWIEVPVPEEVSGKIKVGMPAKVQFDALPGQTVASRVIRMNPAADPQSRQFTVRLSLDNPQGLIKPGMFGRVSLVTESIPDALVVPREAVREGADGASVIVVKDNGETEQREVTLGASDAAGFQVKDGLHSGDKVVILTASRLKGGESVSEGGKKRGKGGKKPS